MASLKEIREKLQAMENRSSGNSNKTRDNAIYPFWNIDKDTTSTVRFLPDADGDNTFFWVERQLIKIPFPGVKGGDTNKPVTVQVPCVEMWGDTCPVHQEIRPWFNDPSLEDIARTYWKKRSYIFQGFVRNDALNENEKPENPIRRFVIGKQLFNIIKSALLDPEMEDIPTDYDAGVDFKISKTMKGSYADYTSSQWARKESSLTEEELAAIEEHGLSNLSDFMPKRPTPEQLNAIFEMFEASVEGELYDPSQWGEFYKPYGLEYNAPKKDEAAAAPEASKTVVVDAPVAEAAKVEPAEKVEAAEPAEASTGGSKSAEDILKMIRNRNN